MIFYKHGRTDVGLQSERLTSSVEDNRWTGLAEGIAVVADYPEMICCATWRRLPLVPRTISAYPVRKVHPLTHHFGITSVPLRYQSSIPTKWYHVSIFTLNLTPMSACLVTVNDVREDHDSVSCRYHFGTKSSKRFYSVLHWLYEVQRAVMVSIRSTHWHTISVSLRYHFGTRAQYLLKYHVSIILYSKSSTNVSMSGYS